jgi:transcriptional regulator
MGKPTDLVQGTVDLLIMKTIAAEPLHGWAIAQRISQLSHDVLQLQQGSLYPALQRLEREGWITATWGLSENNRRARFYRLTRAGRSHLEREQAGWERLSAAIAMLLRTA